MAKWEDSLEDIEFRNNVTMELQQRPGILYPLIGRAGDGAGKSEVKIEDRFGQMTLKQKTTANGDTNYSDLEAKRRWVKKPGSYNDAILIDRDEQNETMVGVQSPAVMAAAAAARKYHDDQVLKGFWGSAWEGAKSGTTEIPFTSGNKIAYDFGGSSGLTLAKLIEARRQLEKANIDIQAEQPIILVDADAVSNLFAINEYKSFDFNASKPLVNGELKPWMGFRFVQANLGSAVAYPESYSLFKPGSYNRLPIIIPSKLHREVWVEFFGKVEPLATKQYSTQVYVEAESAVVRTDEAAAWYIETVPVS